MQEVHSDDTPETFVSDILKAGECMNHPPIVRALAAEAWGVPFLTQAGRIETQPSAGHTSPRGCSTVKNVATEVAPPVRARVDQRGIAVVDHLMPRHRLVEDDRCCGAVGMHRSTGDISVVHAGAVIIATRGGADVYSQSTNGSRVTGDGLAMALRAGVALVENDADWRCNLLIEQDADGCPRARKTPLVIAG